MICNYFKKTILISTMLLSLFLKKEIIAQNNQQKLNVLMIAVDDLKPLLGCYGDSKIITPNIDRLAKSGTVFLNNHCQQAVSAPSRASLLTGCRPDNTKVWDLETVMRDYVSDIVTLPQYLKSRGYETTATGKVFDPRSVDDSHDAVSWSIPYSNVTGDRWLISNTKMSVEAPNNSEADFEDTKLMMKGGELLEKLASGSKPFFLAVGFHKPHLPFVAPKKYWDLYSRESFKIHPFQKHSLNGPEIAYHDSGELRDYDDIPDIGTITEEQQKELIHGYHACVSYIDNLIGQLLDKVEKLGIKEKTVIVLWGDHGWHLGDHGLWTKHTNFEQATRSPLVIYSPNIAGNKKTNSPSEFVDVFPTLCELAGVDTPDKLDGKSLVPLMKDPESLIKQFAVSQYHRIDKGVEAEGYSLRTKKYRYVEWIKGKYKNDKPYDARNIYAKELYDYETDPDETINLAADAGSVSVVADFGIMMKGFFDSLIIRPVKPPVVISSDNLIENAGFEEGVEKGWWLNVWAGADGKIFETNSAYEGNKAALINVTVPDTSQINWVALMSDTMLNIPKGKLTLSLWAKTTQGTKPFRLSIRGFNSAGDVKYYTAAEVTLTTNYQLFTWDVTPDTQYTKKMNLRLQCGKKSGEYIIDKVELRAENETDAPLPEGRRLREIVADLYPQGNLFIGGTSTGDLLNTKSGQILLREFSYITPANDFKQSYIHPDPETWKWDVPDNWVKVTSENKQVIRMHSPISPQCSDWARDDSRTAEELQKNLEEYMTELCKRYNQYPQIKWIDVVNETVDKSTGDWFGPKPGTTLWENPWPKIGFDESHPLKTPLYIKRAFEIANKYAPNIKQIINQHGGMETAAWNKIKALVQYLKEKGLRVDGIGFQAHVDVGWEKEGDNMKNLSDLIDWAHANKLEFHITENNVSLKDQNASNFNEQAETFGAIVKLIRDKSKNGLVTWNLWQIRDCDGEKSIFNPVMFKADGSAKEAYYKVQGILENKPTGIKNGKEALQSFNLLQNYPNPFNPSTKIRFEIPDGSSELRKVKIEIYDVLGRLIETLVDDYRMPGSYEVEFNAADKSSGIYLCKMSCGKYIKSSKMILIK